ncbi:hypothetical protein [Achromobacter kerstersii]|uniref:Uncharacterized protein n=1 Tax=Achromobacter kerstersii TaxID=1353890 RepID=A0A6S7A9V7_9BURK|nr:hypothetical protein [Achromobacter kerstersii]CAB3680894.1 hypothetical protein LMG3441_01586 [Achromobacter kerstersii]
MILSQLSRPFAYLAISHPEKRWVDFILPSVLAVLGTGVTWYLNGKVNFFGAGGVVASILGFVQNLPGFYIAALAAIATFGRADIDQEMPGDPPPMLKTRTVNGVANNMRLTRRRFLCLLFAFLTVECVVLTLFSIGLNSLAPAMQEARNEVWFTGARLAATFVYWFLVAQMLIATLWGIYYLGERIHLSDS